MSSLRDHHRRCRHDAPAVPQEYGRYFKELDATAADTYRYLNFDKVPVFQEKASKVQVSEEMRAEAKKLQAKMNQ